MEEDDRKHLYDVTDDADTLQYKSPNLAIHEHVTPNKGPIFCIAGVLAVVTLALIILIGVTGVTLTRLHTLPVCSQTSTGNVTVGAQTGGNGGTTACNCTSSCPTCNCNCSMSGNTPDPMVTQTLNQILNNATSISAKVDTGIMSSQNNTNLLTQFGQLFSGQFSQLLNMAQSTAAQVNTLSSASMQQAMSMQNVTDTLSQVWQTTGDSAQKLISIVGTLTELKGTGTSTAGVVDDILLVVDRLLELQNGSSLFNSITPVSCQDIQNALPSSPSGWYHVNARDIYCNMGTLCNSTGGWTRLAYLNMNDATVNCPSSDYRYYQSGGKRMCGRNSANSGFCAGTVYPSNGISYSEVCGRVIGYQKGSTDALASNAGINSPYVDGVSITRGSPRQHVWTLASGVWSTRQNGYANCPCTTGSNQNVQSFIGDNYYCESGNPNYGWSHQIYTNDPLWDGQQCLSFEAGCCTNRPYLPWFYRNYTASPTSDYLEVRICGSGGYNDEDCPVNFYEIYVK